MQEKTKKLLECEAKIEEIFGLIDILQEKLVDTRSLIEIIRADERPLLPDGYRFLVIKFLDVGSEDGYQNKILAVPNEKDFDLYWVWEQGDVLTNREKKNRRLASFKAGTGEVVYEYSGTSPYTFVLPERTLLWEEDEEEWISTKDEI